MSINHRTKNRPACTTMPKIKKKKSDISLPCDARFRNHITETDKNIKYK